MFLGLSVAFDLSHSHMLPGILVKAVSFSTGERVSHEQPGELCHADSKPFSSLVLSQAPHELFPAHDLAQHGRHI